MNSIEVPVLSNRDQQNNGSLSTSPLFDVTSGQPSEANEKLKLTLIILSDLPETCLADVS